MKKTTEIPESFDDFSDPSSTLFLEKLIAKHGRKQSAVIPLLLAIQRQYSYLPPELLKKLTEKTEITPGSIRGVSTFYSHFRFQPSGKHRIRVCVGTACYVKGAQRLYDAFRKELNLPPEKDTDAKRLFTLEKVACLGCCMMAPAVQIDEAIYGWVEPAQTDQILSDFLASHSIAQGTPANQQDKNGQGEVKICLCSSCTASGARKVYDELKNCASKFKLRVRPLEVGCTGMSFKSPLMQVKDTQGQLFHYACVDTDGVSSILLHHFKPGSLTRWLDLLLNVGSDPVWRYRIDGQADDSRFWMDSQKRIATDHSGSISPDDLESYRKIGGFEGLKKALNMKAQEIIEEVSKSGLRGRGGGGFPTGTKWKFAAEAKGEPKYVICNGDEGDPGAFMDRMLLESFPFRVIEGMLIAAWTIKAKEGIFYVREEYPLARFRLQKAIDNCYQAGLLGKGILGHDFEVDLRVAEGAGAFVCGEETALINSLEGGRGIPKLRPPFPVEKGLFGHPTLINNVETLATIPWILVHGAENFAAYGTPGSRGTKTFALAGKICRGGLIEVPMGMPLRQIIDEVGGGVARGRKLKAVLIGGPSGGCVPEELMDLPVDYEQLTAAGAIMGSGGLVVLDEEDCIVDMARYFLEFTANESCGKCIFCRIGSQRMLEILNGLCRGKGKKGDLEQLESLSHMVKMGSLCGLGKTAPNPVLSTLKFFREEYVAHLQGRCPAGKCPDLFTFFIKENCTGCTVCSRECPVDAIPFTPWEVATIEQDKCTRCGVCRDVCPVGAVEVEEKELRVKS